MKRFFVFSALFVLLNTAFLTPRSYAADFPYLDYFPIRLGEKLETAYQKLRNSFAIQQITSQPFTPCMVSNCNLYIIEFSYPLVSALYGEFSRIAINTTVDIVYAVTIAKDTITFEEIARIIHALSAIAQPNRADPSITNEDGWIMQTFYYDNVALSLGTQPLGDNKYNFLIIWSNLKNNSFYRGR